MSEQLKKIKQLVELREKARLGGGEVAIDKQHAKGKATARERIALLVDEGSFEELDMFKLHRCHDFGMEKKQFYGDGVVCGSATINGRLVYLYAQDFTVNGGSLSKTMAEKICKVQDLAMKMGAPCIGLEGVSYMFLTGPKVVKTVTGEEVSQEDLGGASVHAKKSGVAHFTAKTEEEFAALIRNLLSYLPQNNHERAPRVACADPIDRKEEVLNEIIPDNPNMAYNMYEVIGAVVDNGEFLEVQRDFAQNIIIGFARFNGQSVGIVANQPKVYAGVLDVNASRKAARFVRFCDAFNIPIVSLVDVPGFLPGTGQEYNAVISHGAKLLYAYGEATVPKVTVTLRKSYGGSHIVMGSKQLKTDINYAWPSAEIAVMGAGGAVAILSAKAAKNEADPKAFLAQKEKEYNDLFTNPYKAAAEGYIDDVIEPRNTRFRICRALEQIATKSEGRPAKKHGNEPL